MPFLFLVNSRALLGHSFVPNYLLGCGKNVNLEPGYKTAALPVAVLGIVAPLTLSVTLNRDVIWSAFGWEHINVLLHA